ncbi:hypothetical protein BAU15_03920 [Enterococcus sp. JM4C]|uniref:ABC transporter ATP-binding protein n=1 Tax=Candidatus Enterococcus huntleyi TaxID=1857217 RepID=UPI00137A0090|nr:ABC transporter ATP-binding protein [Enterococcus sp. JM4C]KAF1295694.1 hypothetical protein BAU15_03920 [Enterococcus sp. JM4C]
MKQIISHFWKENLLIGIILIGASIAQIIASLMNVSMLNALISGEVPLFIEGLVKMLIAYFGFLILTYWQIKQISKAKQQMSTHLREELTNKLALTSYNEFHSRQVGTYASWLTNDITMIESAGFDSFYQIAAGLIGTFLSIVTLFSFHWSLALLSLVIGGLLLSLPKLLQKKMTTASAAVASENESFLSKVSDVLSGYDTLYVFHLLATLPKRTVQASEKLAEKKNNQASVIAKVAVSGALGNVIGQLGILALTGYLVILGKMTVGTLTATGNLGGTIFNTLGNLTQQIGAVQSTRPLFDKFESVPYIATQSTPEIPLESGFELVDVSYAYGEKKILTNQSQRFDLGKKYALVGESGSGKTTLMNILNGKLPEYSGTILFNKQDFKTISLETLHREVLYLDQTPYLFTGTVRENLTLGESYSDEALMTALEQADLGEMVRALPAGLGTSVGENGRLFSGGQKQRLALARGFLREKKVILVDEGTANLDEESALKIEQTLMKQTGVLLIMITHHLRAAVREQLDEIVDLSKG